MERALNVTEILEHILVHLPMRDLFIIQRTCSTWLDAVTGSKKLQQKLWLLPIDDDVNEHPPRLSYHTIVYRNLHLDHLQQIYLIPDEPIALVNVSFLSLPQRRDQGPPRPPTPPRRWVSLNKDSSCRKMLLTSPPSAELKVYLAKWDLKYRRWSDFSDKTCVRLKARDAAGITVGTFLDIIGYEKARHEHMWVGSWSHKKDLGECDYSDVWADENVEAACKTVWGE